jgi:hypothetical protein
MTKEKFIELGIEEYDTIQLKNTSIKEVYTVVEIQLKRGFVKLKNQTDDVSFWMAIEEIDIINHSPYFKKPQENFNDYNKPCVFSEVKDWCILSKDTDFIEICRWGNDEGMDITINDTTIGVTDGQFNLINALVKKLNKNTES